MKIIIDTREQAPFAFRHERMDATTEPGTLAVGDYSLAGLEDRVAVERKSLPDLVMCLGRERERFERELARGAALDAFAVVCEGSWLELSRGGVSEPPQSSRGLPECACLCREVSPPLPLCREQERGGIYDVGISPAISGRGKKAVEGHCRGARGGITVSKC